MVANGAVQGGPEVLGALVFLQQAGGLGHETGTAPLDQRQGLGGPVFSEGFLKGTQGALDLGRGNFFQERGQVALFFQKDGRKGEGIGACLEVFAAFDDFVAQADQGKALCSAELEVAAGGVFQIGEDGLDLGGMVGDFVEGAQDLFQGGDLVLDLSGLLEGRQMLFRVGDGLGTV